MVDKVLRWRIEIWGGGGGGENKILKSKLSKIARNTSSVEDVAGN